MTASKSLPYDATAAKFGLTAQTTDDRNDLACLPIDRGLTVALSRATEYVPDGSTRDGGRPHYNTREVLVFRVTHHSGLALSGHHDRDWPSTKAGLASARAVLAELHAASVDWSADWTSFGPEGPQRERAMACRPIITAAQDRFVLDGGRLLRTSRFDGGEAPREIGWRIYLRTDREQEDGRRPTPGKWERFARKALADADPRVLGQLAARLDDRFGYRPEATLYDQHQAWEYARGYECRATWEREELPRLDASTFTRATISATHSLLDFGVLDTVRGPERIALVVPDMTAWPTRIAELHETLTAYELAHEASRSLPNYRHSFGTWSKGVRMGEIRWPARYMKEQRATMQAEQIEADAARSRAASLLERVQTLADGIERGAAMLGPWALVEDAAENVRRLAALDRASQLLAEIEQTVDRVAAMLGYPDAQTYRGAIGLTRLDVDRAREPIASVAAYGFGVGARARVVASKSKWGGAENEPTNPVAVLQVKLLRTDGKVQHIRTIEDARGRTWDYWPVERLEAL